MYLYYLYLGEEELSLQYVKINESDGTHEKLEMTKTVPELRDSAYFYICVDLPQHRCTLHSEKYRSHFPLIASTEEKLSKFTPEIDFKEVNGKKYVFIRMNNEKKRGLQ